MNNRQLQFYLCFHEVRYVQGSMARWSVHMDLLTDTHMNLKISAEDTYL